MSAENKSFFKKIADKFGVGKEPEKPIEEITEPSDVSVQEEQIEESSALRPVEIPIQEVSPATSQEEPSLSQPVEEGLPCQPEQEPSELAPEEILELTKED